MTANRFDVPVGTGAPGGETAAYLLGDDGPLLVDPAGRTDALDEAVAERDPDHIAVTHQHPDHVGAVAHYASVTDATVWARRGRETAFESATGVVPDRTFAEGTVIETGGEHIDVIATPGHAPEHVGFALDDVLLCGDLAVASGSVAVSAPAGDMRAYLTSLRRVHALAPDRMRPGHGPEISDPRATCRRLIDHRLAREAAVENAVREGAATPDAVVDAAYEKDVTGVRALARATVVAHLEKLAVEGRVRWDGERATPR